MILSFPGTNVRTRQLLFLSEDSAEYLFTSTIIITESESRDNRIGLMGENLVVQEVIEDLLVLQRLQVRGKVNEIFAEGDALHRNLDRDTPAHSVFKPVSRIAP